LLGKSSQVSHSITRFLSFLFRAVWACFHDLLPQLQARWHKGKTTSSGRSQIRTHFFENIWIADGSTLEALFRKLESLQDAPQGKLAGKLCHRPINDCQYKCGFTPIHLHTIRISWPICSISPATLLILDRGFYDFGFFLRLSKVDFITRIKSNAAFEVERILSSDYTLRPFDLLQNRWHKTNHCYGCASSKSAKVKQCMVTSPQC